MTWPDCWREHWIVAIFKKGAVYKAKNYRGVHLTAQLSKVAERILKNLMLPYINRTVAFGENQFAYSKKKGARDALAHLVIEWIQILNARGKLVVYSSDVAGAFDKVSVKRLLEKLRKKGFDEQFVRLIESWLAKRRAQVIVSGHF